MAAIPPVGGNVLPAVPQVAVVAPQVVAPVPFSMAPVFATNGDVLDFTKVENIKFYNRAIGALEQTAKFDLSPGKLKGFLHAIENRARSTAWTTILEVPMDIAYPLANRYSLITQYGQISWGQVQASVMSYNNTQSRLAQDSEMLYLSLSASLTDEASTHMALFRNQYTINGHPAGAAFLKLIIMESYVDTQASTRLTREKLSSLDTYMVSVKSDVEKFNLYVRDQVASLEARGEITEDLLANLFKAYAKASDREFKLYMKKKEDDYDDGAILHPTSLMQQALNKYRSLVEQDMWNAPSDEETKIIALEAKIKKMFKSPSAAKKDGKGDVNKALKDGKKKKKERFEKPTWLKDKPKAGEPTKKTEAGKDYHWCPKHEAWGRHEPEDCEGVGIKFEDLKNKGKAKGTDSKKTLKIARALASVAEGDDSDSDASEE
jgi:hypothetical protein